MYNTYYTNSSCTCRVYNVCQIWMSGHLVRKGHSGLDLDLHISLKTLKEAMSWAAVTKVQAEGRYWKIILDSKSRFLAATASTGKLAEKMINTDGAAVSWGESYPHYHALRSTCKLNLPNDNKYFGMDLLKGVLIWKPRYFKSRIWALTFRNPPSPPSN